MLEEIKNYDNKLLQAQMLTYLINNKKISKILKSSYIKYFTKLFDELEKCYYVFNYEIDLKAFFNNEHTNNNVLANFISTSNYINYSVTLNYTIKNKHLVETILKTYNIEITEESFKNMKKLLSGKIESFEFETDFGDMILTHEELLMNDISQKSFKECIKFNLPNTVTASELKTYPLVFTHITTENSKLIFNIFSEENILETRHYSLPKNKIKKILNSS